ncbi:MAG: aminotransferase class V-fold PLP-dependent enzyme, partial [Qipengyuania sp.]
HQRGFAPRIAVGRINDYTGQIAPEGGTRVTQGAALMAMSAFAKAGARLVASVEHDCVLQAAPAAERLPVRSDGALDLEVLTETVQRERPLVAVQQVNSETGNRQDLAAIGGIVHQAGGLLLADCAQGAGRFALPSCDMAIISAHKFGGPIGIGAMLVTDYAMLAPSGGQERGYRRGTENMPGVMGMA